MVMTVRSRLHLSYLARFKTKYFCGFQDIMQPTLCFCLWMTSHRSHHPQARQWSLSSLIDVLSMCQFSSHLQDPKCCNKGRSNSKVHWIAELDNLALYASDAPFTLIKVAVQLKDRHASSWPPRALQILGKGQKFAKKMYTYKLWIWALLSFVQANVSTSFACCMSYQRSFSDITQWNEAQSWVFSYFQDVGPVAGTF